MKTYDCKFLLGESGHMILVTVNPHLQYSGNMNSFREMFFPAADLVNVFVKWISLLNKKFESTSIFVAQKRIINIDPP